MLKLKRKTWIIIIGAVVVALITVIVVSQGRNRNQTSYATATTARGDIIQTVAATGTLQPWQIVSVGAQVSGRVESLKVQLGDHVRKGQVIATIDPIPATNQLRTAQATLAQQTAQRAAQAATLAQANLALQRQKITLAADASSRADYEAAVANAEAARASLAAIDAQIAQARVSVDTAGVNLSYTNVVAPIDGQVLAVVTKQGQTVNAVQAAPTIVILGDMSTMTVEAKISEADAVKVRPGQDASFTILGAPDRKFTGRLRSLAPAPASIVSEVTSTAAASNTSTTAIYYDGFFDTPNADGVLRADMTAQVTVVIAKARNVITVPTAALDLPLPGAPPIGAGPPGTHLVQVLDAEGRPKARTVRTRLTNNVVSEVVSGLAAGERVVVGVAAARQAGAPGPGGGRPARPL